MDTNTNPETKSGIDPAVPPSGTGDEGKPETPPQEPSQPPVPTEPKRQFTKRERLEFTLGKIQKELDELDEADDSKPVTMGDLRKMQQEAAKKTAVQLADSIEDEVERLEVQSLLESRIIPSGDPAKDLQLARHMVNAEKNAQVAQEIARKQTPSSHAHTPASPGAHPEDVFTPTEQEQMFMAPPYNLSKEAILASRKAAERQSE